MPSIIFPKSKSISNKTASSTHSPPGSEEVDSDALKSSPFVLSVDTLYGRTIDSTITKGWRDRPPFLTSMTQKRNKFQKRKRLLKEGCKAGVPQALRGAVWITSVVRYGGHQSHEEDSSAAVLYGTQEKARAIDREWDIVVQKVFPPTDEIDAPIPTFGTDRNQLMFFLEAKSTRDWTTPIVTDSGLQAMTRVLSAVHEIVGVEYCPMLPYITALLLSHMPESYAYLTLSKLVRSSHAYVPTSVVEHYQWCKTFADTVSRMFPETYQDMVNIGALTPEGLAPIFERFFVDLFPREHVLRIIDVYTISGSKTIFRFGIALISLVKTKFKAKDILTTDEWWNQVRDYTFSPTFRFDSLLERAYKNIGGHFYKSVRFPSKRVLLRLHKENEKWARGNAPVQNVEVLVRPLGLSDGPNECSLAKSSAVRKNLATWLPPTLRGTKLDLIFSTNVHGRSIRNFYECCSNTKRTILLVEVLQTGAIIGVFADLAWHIDSGVYGDGNCFVFRASPNPKCFKWQPPSNPHLLFEEDVEKAALWNQFMVGKRNYIAVGANMDGSCALRLNEDLTIGMSGSALGYNNEPLAGEGYIDFEVGQVEVYRFIRGVDGLPLD